MAVRMVNRRGERRWIIDIRYTQADGTPGRFRHDAEVQTGAAARVEERRRLAALALTGSPEVATLASPTPTNGSNGAAPKVAPETEPAKALTATFGETAKEYLASFATSHLKPSTLRGYKAVLEGFLLPRLRERPIGEIDAAVVRKLDIELVERGVTPSTRRQMQAVIRSVLCRYAVEAGLLDEPPRLPRLPKSGRKIVNVLTQDDFTRLLAAAPCELHRLAFLLAADAGLRAGEIRGLRFRDIDLKTGRIVVRESICHGVAATPKSGHERIVPMTPRLKAKLEQLPAKGQQCFVSLNMRGTPWTDYTLHQAFVRACAKAELGSWRLHDLRHLFVTSCFRAGVSAPTVQALAGHSHLTTTQRYSHVVSVDLADGIAKLGRLAGVTEG